MMVYLKLEFTSMKRANCMNRSMLMFRLHASILSISADLKCLVGGLSVFSIWRIVQLFFTRLQVCQLMCYLFDSWFCLFFPLKFSFCIDLFNISRILCLNMFCLCSVWFRNRIANTSGSTTGFADEWQHFIGCHGSSSRYGQTSWCFYITNRFV